VAATYRAKARETRTRLPPRVLQIPAGCIMTFYYVIKLVGYAEQSTLIPKRLYECVSNLMLQTYVGERHPVSFIVL
jgi:hypothetical protein